MIYEALLETSAGPLKAVWDGGSEIKLYFGADDIPLGSIELGDDWGQVNRIPLSAEALAKLVLAWVLENERGLEIERVIATTSSEIDIAS